MAGTFLFPTFGAVADPVVPQSGTGTKSFQATYEVLSSPNLTVIQRKVLAIVALISLASAIGDTHDYSAAHKQLIDDAQAFAGLIPNYDLDTGLGVIFYAGAKAATAGFTNNITTQLTTGQLFAALPEITLDAIISLLLYRALV